jgi:hypothetical protein
MDEYSKPILVSFCVFVYFLLVNKVDKLMNEHLKT